MAAFVGSTPSEVRVAEGDHTIVVKKSGFKNWERKLKSSSGSSVSLNAEMEKADSHSTAAMSRREAALVRLTNRREHRSAP
jgi:PEGA domain